MVNRDAAPERLLLVVERAEARDRYLLARWEDWPHPSLVATSPPHEGEGLDAAVAAMLRGAFGVALMGVARRGDTRWPVRMAHPRFGGEGVGWLRAVAAMTSGEPVAGPLVQGLVELDADEAEAQLSTEVERAVFRSGVALLAAARMPSEPAGG